MAQLRDANTSELLAEGTPLEVALVADELGHKAVVVKRGEELPDDADSIYDDVGEAFDAAAVLAAHREQVDAFTKLARSRDKNVDAAGAKTALEDRKATEAAARNELAPAAAEALDEARDRVS